MGVPTSEVGYTAAMSRREDHEDHKDMWWGHWTESPQGHVVALDKKSTRTCGGGIGQKKLLIHKF